jgi:hypothetical protein
VVKQPAAKNGTSRIRFIMLEAEIAEGDLGQITAAIQNALKPNAMVVQRQVAGTPASLPNSSPNIEAAAEVEPIDEYDDEQPDAEPPRPARETRPRKPTVPKVLELDLTSGVSFEAFANAHPPKNDVERNLVVLAWFKEHRSDEPVTANHVYTCYRAIKWPSGIDDFSWPLRSLKKEQLVTSAGRGQYAINHLGIARVEKMDTTA